MPTLDLALTPLPLPLTLDVGEGRCVTLAPDRLLWGGVLPTPPTEQHEFAGIVLHDADWPRAGDYLGREREGAAGRFVAHWHTGQATSGAGYVGLLYEMEEAAGRCLPPAAARRVREALRAGGGAAAGESPMVLYRDGVRWEPARHFCLPLPLVLRAGEGWARVSKPWVPVLLGHCLTVAARGPRAADPWVTRLERLERGPDAQHTPEAWRALRDLGADTQELGRLLVDGAVRA